MSDDFSWDDCDSVVVNPVSGIAVYENPEGNIVIRLEWGDEFIAIPRQHARKVAAAINRLLKKGGR